MNSNFKKVAYFAVTLLFFLSLSGVVIAQSPSPLSSAKAQIQADRIAKFKAKGDKEIARRVTSLTDLITKLNSFKKLSDADKQNLTGQVQTEISNLGALKTKIDADTDIATLQTDIQSIVKSYRIYLLFIPKIHILAAADRMGQAAESLGTLATKLQTKIQEAQAGGSDVSSLQASLTDMQAKIADSKVQYSAAESEVLPLTPDGYPGNKAQLLDAQSKIKKGAQDLRSALQDAKTIIKGLKELKSKNSTQSATTK